MALWLVMRSEVLSCRLMNRIRLFEGQPISVPVNSQAAEVFEGGDHVMGRRGGGGGGEGVLVLLTDSQWKQPLEAKQRDAANWICSLSGSNTT